MEQHHNNLDIALDAHDKGLVAIPCHPGTKIPRVRWKEYQEQLPTIELLREWFREECNLAIITTGMVVFDCDDPTKRDLVIEKCGETSHLLKSPRGGFHLGYRRRKGVALINQVKIKGMKIDIRTNGGLEMIPNSRTEHGRYEWLGTGLQPITSLPIANIGWTRERKKICRLVQQIIEGDPAHRLQRARAYLQKVPGAVSGQKGHNATFRVCCLLVQKFGLGEAEAWPLLLEWNQTCEPPWSERELAHKLSDALQKRQ